MAKAYLAGSRSQRERVLNFKGKIGTDAETNPESLQIDEDKFVESTIGIDDSINHSCKPNCYIDWKRLDIVALRDIRKGEEITFNYLTSEYDLVNSKTPSYFRCSCGSKNCHKIIRGFKYLPIKEKLKLRKFLSPYLRKKLREELRRAIMKSKNKFGNVACPECSHKQRMAIPKDICIPFYKCNNCNKMIKSRSCCVFCDYGDTLCPVSIKK